MKNTKTLAVDILFDIVGSFLYSVGIYCFAESANIAPGGVSGIAIMAKHLFGFPIGIFGFVANIPLLMVAQKKLSRKFVFKTLCTLVTNCVILDEVVSVYLPQYNGERIISCIFAGVFTGVGLALIFMRGSSTGGTDIVSFLIEKKHPHIQIGKAIMAIDFSIAALSGIVFQNVDSALFGIVTVFCQSRIIDCVVYGANKGRQIIVISPKNKIIAEKIMKNLSRGVTFLKACGAYENKEFSVVLCVVNRREFNKIKSIVHTEDENAFMITSETTETFGNGFKNLK